MCIDAKGKSTDQLIKVAAGGAQKKSQLIISNAESKTTDQLL